MKIQTLSRLSGAALLAGMAVFVLSSPASALTMAECSTKYQAAKDAGTLGTMKWNDFRKAQCGTDTSAAPAAAPAAPAKPATAAKPAKQAPAADTADAAKGLTMQQCSAKYKAAQETGLATGLKWNAFRKAECGPGADPEMVTSVSTKEPAAPTVAAPSGVKFPSAVSGKYATETEGKQRMKTCLDQYYANKSANSLNGLRWIQKGGGYYSLCNARLKGNS
ncbi:antifreeze protein [Pseudochrobactrum sp. sp1633]|uniref:antifreeze protein n=1 Tax=Pseudochrobactrum sp. sp1633 TaxID=3036706 RepID=UPI0025A5D580|nr:antifreeze protein [Pseudochrobactrum sp. sp1633]MDM8345138.1 antifreeze protein [Pseudochrobactrum sp. sp1633]HWD13011.1 antifreeze protein [Pseudochrobactrum sp.]